MKILVTGGAGFIGSHIVDAFLEDGHEVYVIDDLSSGNADFVNKQAGFYKLDICDKNLSRIFEAQRFDVLCHLAAQIDVRSSVADPAFDVDVNIKGLINLLEAGRQNGLQKVIFASTGGAIYGEPDFVPQDEFHLERPLSPYGINKLASERYLYFYFKTYGIPYVALRYGNVYGPRQNPHGEAGVVAIFAELLLSGKRPRIYGDGKQTRDFVYVKDVVEANRRALAYEGAGTFNIGTGAETSVNMLYSHLADLTDFEGSPSYEPGKPGEQRRSVLDFKRAREKLGWMPAFSIKEGLADTVMWFKESVLLHA